MNRIIFPLIILSSLFVSSIATAEPPAVKSWKKNGSKHNINSNRQSDPYSTRGLDRADERHQLKSYKKQNKHRDQRERDDRERGKYYEKRDDRERGKYYEKGSKRTITSEEILENEIDNAHRRAVDSIADKTRPSKAWWKFWGSEE